MAREASGEHPDTLQRCTIALTTAGLDPDLGWLHRDAPYRASAALDVQEALRPVADAFVLDLIRTRTFSQREFSELRSGQVRLSSSLAKPLAQAALPMLESAVQPVVEEVVRILAASSDSPIRIRKRRAPVKIGQVQPRPMSKRSRERIASACRICGLVLDDPDRSICDECLPEYDQARTDKLSKAGKATLAAMRSLGDADPAHSVEARAKRAASSARAVSANREWERTHGRSFDVKAYRRDVVPRIRSMTVPQLMRLTGLSQHHLWSVREGHRRLHPRHWSKVLAASERDVDGPRL